MPAAVAVPLIAAGIGGATTLAATKMSSNATKTAVQQQADQAAVSQARSQPAFDQAYKYYSDILKGGSALQGAVAPAANNVSAQWDQAYKNILNNAYTRGGALDKGLRAVQTGRAFNLSDLYGNAQQQAIAGLTGLASGDAANAATLLGNVQQQQQFNAQQKAAALQGVGSIFTRLLSTPGLFAKTPAVVDTGGPSYGPNLPNAFAGLTTPNFTAYQNPNMPTFTNNPYDLRSYQTGNVKF